MNSSTIRVHVWKATLCVMVVAAPGLAAPRGVNPVNALPTLSASAEAPKNVQSGKIEFYKIIGKDQDTFNAPPVPTQVLAPDEMIHFGIVSAPSFDPNNRFFAHRGLADDGTHTWDVIGKVITVTAITIKMDTWRVSNQRLAGDPQLDTPQDVTQFITITP